MERDGCDVGDLCGPSAEQCKHADREFESDQQRDPDVVVRYDEGGPGVADEGDVGAVCEVGVVVAAGEEERVHRGTSADVEDADTDATVPERAWVPAGPDGGGDDHGCTPNPDDRKHRSHRGRQPAGVVVPQVLTAE